MRSSWWLVGLLWAGCRLDVSFEESHFYCGSGGSCPADQACVQDYCQRSAVGPVDASTPLIDASPPQSDASPGNPDAQPGNPDAASPPDAAPQPDAMPSCLLGNVADDFSTSATAPFWVSFAELPTTVSETAGRLVVSLAPNTAGTHFAGYVHGTITDGRGQHIDVEVAVAPNPSSAANAFFKLQNGANYDNQATFVLEAGVLYMDTYDASYNRLSRASITFSATNHRYWALEESGGQVRFLTSPDGTSWTLREQEPVPFPFENARVALGGGTWKSESSPGSVQFNRLNVGPSTNCFGYAE